MDKIKWECAHYEEGKPVKCVTKILVNARSVDCDDETINYFELGQLVFPKEKMETVLTIQYSRGKDKAQGTLTAGEAVGVVDGMVFDVTITGSS